MENNGFAVMESKERIDIEDVLKAHQINKKLNSFNLSEIDFFENGIKIAIDLDILEEYSYTGMSNDHFITSSFYKEGFDKDNE